MRTLQLTDQQVELIQFALGISELKLSNIYNEIIKFTITIRNAPDRHESDENAKYYYEKACEFADLNINIKNGELDV